MTKKVSRIIGIVLLILAIIFAWYALNHPEGSFPWSNTVSYMIYGIYILAMLVFLAAPFRKK